MAEHMAQRPIRVAHLITGLGSGGAEAMLCKLCLHMDRSRFENRVYALTEGGLVAEQLRAAGIPVVSLGSRRGTVDPRAIWRLWRALRAYRPDLLQTWLYHADLLGTLVAPLAGIPHLAWNIRCSDMDFSHYSRLTRLVVSLCAILSHRPDRVVVNSEHGRRVHEMRLGYHPRRWDVIPNGFDLEHFRPAPEMRARLRRELGVPENCLLAGLVARFDPMKDHRGFLQAARSVADGVDDVHFVLVGRDVTPGNVLLASWIREFHLESRVHCLGERADLNQLMPALDIAVLASAFGEGFPNVLGEAMACGVPCVTTDVGDAAILVGGNGRVVPPRAPSALSSAMSELLHLSAQKRGELGAAARERISAQYGIEAVVERYGKLYGELARCAA